jgi:hypothetical protein
MAQYRTPLREQWVASRGAKLNEAVQLGTRKVVELMAKDLLDVKPVDVRKLDVIGWRVLLEVTAPGRYTSLFIGGPFAGALMSEPSGYTVEYCTGTVFSETAALPPYPRLCPGEFR